MIMDSDTIVKFISMKILVQDFEKIRILTNNWDFNK